MRRACLIALAAFLLAFILITTACLTYEVPGGPSTETCPAITEVTSVLVLLPPGVTVKGKNSYRLTDPDALGRLTAFVNQRREAAAIDADTAPYPKLRAIFYNGYKILAVFGPGPDVFYFQCGRQRGTRHATQSELEQFRHLIEAPAN